MATTLPDPALKHMVVAAAHRAFKRLGVAGSGLAGSPKSKVVEEVKVINLGHALFRENDMGVDAYTVAFRLPRFNGKATVPLSDLRGVVRPLPLSVHTIDQVRDEAARKRDAQIDAVVYPALEQAARELRGRALLELADQDWDVAEGTPEQWQSLERAALRLMTMADARRR